MSNQTLKQTEYPSIEVDTRELDIIQLWQKSPRSGETDLLQIEVEKVSELCELINPIDWKALRNKFFEECTDTISADMLPTRKVVNLAPHDLFEWFKKNVRP